MSRYRIDGKEQHDCNVVVNDRVWKRTTYPSGEVGRWEDCGPAAQYNTRLLRTFDSLAAAAEYYEGPGRTRPNSGRGAELPSKTEEQIGQETGAESREKGQGLT